MTATSLQQQNRIGQAYKFKLCFCAIKERMTKKPNKNENKRDCQFKTKSTSIQFTSNENIQNE